MKKNILIVGGTGVISFAVVKQALSQGFDVTCINRGKNRTQTVRGKGLTGFKIAIHAGTY